MFAKETKSTLNVSEDGYLYLISYYIVNSSKKELTAKSK